MEAQDFLHPEVKKEINNIPEKKNMTTRERIKFDFNYCFKTRDLFTKNFLGLILSEIALEESRQRKINEIAIQTLLRKMKANLEEIGNEESLKERDILLKYIDAFMSEEEIVEKINEIIAETGASSPSDIGKVMGTFTSKYKGKADNGIVSRIVKETLNKI